MRSLILIVGAALALSACTASDTGDVNSNSNVLANISGGNVDDVDCGLTSDSLNDEKALFAAETAYNVAADAYVRLSATNKLSAGVKTMVQPKLVRAYDFLKLARTAYAAGDGCSLKRYSDLAEALGNEVKGQLN